MMAISQISIITGANRGFGKTIAESLIKLGSQKDAGTFYNFIILVSREASKMDEVLKELDKMKGMESSIIKSVSGVELSNLEELPVRITKINTMIESFVSDPNFKNSCDKRLVLFNNAGSLGDISKKATELLPLEVHEYSAINFSSFSFFCTEFKKWQNCAAFDKSTIVNTSSLAAIQPFSYNSLYCSIKAARDMYLKVIALEEPTIKTLNYAPGPMDNDMQSQIRQAVGDPDSRVYFQKLFDENKLVKMEDSVSKLLHILFYDAYESGAHIDFYDYKDNLLL